MYNQAKDKEGDLYKILLHKMKKDREQNEGKRSLDAYRFERQFHEYKKAVQSITSTTYRRYELFFGQYSSEDHLLHYIYQNAKEEYESEQKKLEIDEKRYEVPSYGFQTYQPTENSKASIGFRIDTDLCLIDKKNEEMIKQFEHDGYYYFKNITTDNIPAVVYALVDYNYEISKIDAITDLVRKDNLYEIERAIEQKISELKKLLKYDYPNISELPSTISIRTKNEVKKDLKDKLAKLGITTYRLDEFLANFKL